MSNIVAKGVLTGKLSGKQSISGKLSSKGVLQGTINVWGGGVKTYDGKYEVDPFDTEQTLNTKQKFLEKDITVHPVKYYEVSNETGGSTVYIGKEVNNG